MHWKSDNGLFSQGPSSLAHVELFSERVEKVQKNYVEFYYKI